MKYNLYINQVQALELGITNINQAHIFDLLTTCAVWADPIVIDDTVYYFVARQQVIKELEILNLKPDTVYRHYKSLDVLGLINYKKSGKKDCVKITKKGKKYHSDTMSEINPNNYVGNKSEYYVGNKSENNSEINPTYHTTRIKPTNNKNKQKKVCKNLVQELKEDEEINTSEESILTGFIDYRKKLKKVIKTVPPLKAFLKELRNIHTAGFDIKAAIELMKEKEWQTLKLDWIKNSMQSKAVAPTGTPKASTFYAATKEQKQEDKNKTLANIANVRKLMESGEI